MEVLKFHPLPVFLPQHIFCRHVFARAGVAFLLWFVAIWLASRPLAAPPLSAALIRCGQVAVACLWFPLGFQARCSC